MFIPKSYESWRQCITIRCGIPLTEPYIETRLKELNAATSYEVTRFRELYGDAHWLRVKGWFEQARSELKPAH